MAIPYLDKPSDDPSLPMNKPAHPSILDIAEDALIDAAQFMDGVKPDAVAEGWWTEWDGDTREKISKALFAINEQKS